MKGVHFMPRTPKKSKNSPEKGPTEHPLQQDSALAVLPDMSAADDAALELLGEIGRAHV